MCVCFHNIVVSILGDFLKHIPFCIKSLNIFVGKESITTPPSNHSFWLRFPTKLGFSEPNEY